MQLALAFRLGRWRGKAVVAPPDRLDPREQFPGAERLHHIIVSANLQADHAIDLIAARREENTGISENFRTFRQTSNPSMSGNPTSSTMRVGAECFASSIALRPRCASDVVTPA
jgi:hypothetical protein